MTETSQVELKEWRSVSPWVTAPQWAGTALVFASLYYQAFLKARLCSMTVSKVVWKAPIVSALETRISIAQV